MLDPLISISPVDGRYRAQTEQLGDYFSEFALIRYRVRVEIEYFIALCEIPLPQLQGVSPSFFPAMRKIYQDFGLEEAFEIKATEKITNHDVKAVEYFIKERFRKMGLERYVEFVHFGLTSQDINNTATPLSLLEGIRDVYMPVFENLLSVLRKMEQEWAQVSMLARTHGQPASPTRLGKEIGVFTARLQEQKTQLNSLPYSANGGATGNLNAHHVAYPS